MGIRGNIFFCLFSLWFSTLFNCFYYKVRVLSMYLKTKFIFVLEKMNKQG